MKLVIALLALLLCGCVGLGEMKLRDGEAGCDTVTLAYGSASRIVSRVDNVPKGSTSDNTTEIRCGQAAMSVTNKIGAPVQPGATTTTTTTTVTPAKTAP